MSKFRIEKAVAQFIAENNLFADEKRVLLAVSGGGDSMSLMLILSRLKKAGSIDVELSLAHVNHQLRGADSDADEAFVLAQARKFCLPIKTRRVDVRQYSIANKLSIETAARNLRIKTLCEIAQENKCGCIATAHQKNDNAETIIHRLMRGTSFRGLAGIWPKKQFANGIYFVRPLLDIARDEIETYLRSCELEWRIDKSNYDYKYTRNRIRHQLLGVLEKDCKRPLIDQLAKLAHNGYKFNEQLGDEVQKVWPGCVISPRQTEYIDLDLKILLSQPRLIQVELVRRALVWIGSGERNLTALHYAKILRFAEVGETGKKIELPGQFFTQKGYGKISFAGTEPNSIVAPEKGVTLGIPGKTRFGNMVIEAKFLDPCQCDIDSFRTQKDHLVEWFDADKIALPLTIRPCCRDDKFRPLGMQDNKKVSKFMTDAKIDRNDRNIFAICDKDAIVWLCPLRIGEMAKICKKTSKILQLNVMKVENLS